MKIRYFVSDDFKIKLELVGLELVFDGYSYAYKNDNYGVIEYCFTSKGGYWEKYVVKVEEMELSDFIADGRTKYELNGIRFVVDSVSHSNGFITIKTDKHCSQSDILNSDGASSGRVWAIFSRNTESAKHYGSHIEDIKLVTTCEQCGKDEVQDAGLCSDCISKLPKIESRKVVDIHQNENGSFSVGSVVNMCEHDEIVYTSSQYVEAIEKEVPDAVNHPSHYTGSGIECIEAIKASMTPDALAGYLKGNVQKYLWRYEKKVNPVEDLKKARWYLDYLINEMEQTNV